MRKRFIISKPLSATCFDKEWKSCLLQLEEMRNKGLSPVKFNIFVAGNGSGNTVKDIRKKITGSVISAFMDCTPAFSISVHPPEDSRKVIVEAMFAEPSDNVIETLYSDSLPYVRITSENDTELYCCGIGTDCPFHDTGESAVFAFNSLQKILETEGMSMNNIVRQWNFIGNILEQNNGHQNYQVFNEVRHDYYQRFRTIPWYPSATGIGMMSDGVLIDIFALRSDDHNVVIPLDNPNQVRAYEYGQEVLAGQPVKPGLKNSPKFERAILLLKKNDPTLFISGTASIIGQVTLGKGDVEKQTRITIENIRRLADPLTVSGIDDAGRPCNLTFRNVRVYIKYLKDFDLVRDICSSHFGEIPAVYLLSDICRDDLLMEIEAELSVTF